MATRTAQVRHTDGLHVRPAELVAKAAMRFQSDVALVNGSLRVDAKSILNVITLGAHEGAELIIEANGPDAEEAVATLAELLESDFGSDEVSIGSASQAETKPNNQAG